MIGKSSSVCACILLTGFGIWLSGLGSCRSSVKTYHKNISHAEVKDEQIAKGEILAARYCQSCHLLPTPELLDAATWENGVLPQMGPRLGIFEYIYKQYPNNSGDPNVGRDFYPSEPLMSMEDWGALMDYYTALSPDTLPPQQRKEALRADTTLFAIEKPSVPGGNLPAEGTSSTAGSFPAAGTPSAIGTSSATVTPPATCYIGYDTLRHEIFTADIIKHTLDRWNGRLERLPSLMTGGSVVSMAGDGNGYTVCNIGAFAPTNGKAGYIDRISIHDRRISQDTPSLYNGLMRPVQILSADLNGDGKKDLLVCEFGFIKGELSWLENKGNNKFEKHVLRNVPGAIRAVVQDYNHDGLPDIWVLFAQGDEGIFLYTNKGHGQFEERQVLRFPACYGSTYFELDDFNQDGNPDILYTCGDNGDFSTVLKPYHGVYIYMNDGTANFVQRYFFPVNGCYRAMAADLNRDGRTDIAAISYFADYHRQPEEGFVYLQNEGDMKAGDFKFSPHSVPGTEVGRWITMDVRDIDGDGKPDILLANCSVGPSFNKSGTDWKKGPPFIVLKNRGK